MKIRTVSDRSSRMPKIRLLRICVAVMSWCVGVCNIFYFKIRLTYNYLTYMTLILTLTLIPFFSGSYLQILPRLQPWHLTAARPPDPLPTRDRQLAILISQVPLIALQSPMTQFYTAIRLRSLQCASQVRRSIRFSTGRA